jgi:formylglycine-generating enzyme required for sulfatase activity
VAGGSASDVTRAGIRNLAGNVGEWLADALEAYDAPCWTGPSPLVDPRCTPAGQSDTDVRASRGASWALPPLSARSAHRDGGRLPNPYTGLRCAISR